MTDTTKYGIYVSERRIPRKRQNTLGEAVVEACRLAKLTELPAFVIEYGVDVKILCQFMPDGSRVDLS